MVSRTPVLYRSSRPQPVPLRHQLLYPKWNEISNLAAEVTLFNLQLYLGLHKKPLPLYSGVIQFRVGINYLLLASEEFKSFRQSVH